MDETKLGVEYDSRFYELLSWYAKTDLENDRLEEVDLRATTALGLKYLWIDDKPYKFSVRSGLAFRFEEYGLASQENVDALALDFGIEYTHNIKELFNLESDITIIPSVEELSDYLITKDTALVVPLAKKFKLAAQNRFGRHLQFDPSQKQRGIGPKILYAISVSFGLKDSLIISSQINLLIIFVIS